VLGLTGNRERGGARPHRQPRKEEELGLHGSINDAPPGRAASTDRAARRQAPRNHADASLPTSSPAASLPSSSPCAANRRWNVLPRRGSTPSSTTRRQAQLRPAAGRISGQPPQRRTRLLFYSLLKDLCVKIRTQLVSTYTGYTKQLLYSPSLNQAGLPNNYKILVGLV
jgi:hypothetical protein